MKQLFSLLISFLILFSFSCSSVDPGSVLEGDDFAIPGIYHNPDEIVSFLTQTRATYPDITRLEIVGYSVQGRPIYSLIISDNPELIEVDEPRVRLAGSIHGNEYISGEILIRYIEYLTQNYNAAAPSETVTSIINSRYISIIPVVNPDGLAVSSRYNSNNVDLNRNFSTAWAYGGSNGTAPFSEPESAAFRDYSLSRKFHLSATFHSGVVILNMPFDYGKESLGVFPVENELVNYMAQIYTTSGTFLDNPYLMTGLYVNSGTINGGDWYIATGTLQDWSYVEAGCLDMTVEIANSSPKDSAGIQEVFLYNRDSITAYIDASGTGVYGVIKDSSDVPIEGARVLVNDGVSDGDLITVTDINGFYYKVLKPGSYTLKISAAGYSDFSQAVSISSLYESINLNIQLNP